MPTDSMKITDSKRGLVSTTVAFKKPTFVLTRFFSFSQIKNSRMWPWVEKVRLAAVMKKLDKRGVAALEFCLVAVPLFTLMFAIFCSH
jgi:hypothetical protein